MAFFDDAELNAMAIEHMVFHLVGPKPESFVRLEAVDPGPFAPFFLERIRLANSGVPYAFSDASSTRQRLSRMLTDPATFQEESEKLAEDFQRGHGGTTAAGAFLVFALRIGEARAFALLKSDDELVLSYEVQEGPGGRKRVSLEEIERTFVQSREALQKSALIKLTDTGGDLCVLDRRNQQKVARYFETFLNASRVHEDSALTAKLVEVTRKVIKDNPELVPPEVYREVTRRTFEAASGGGKLGVDDQKTFLEAVIGRALPNDNPLVEIFTAGLRQARIDGLPMTLDIATVSQPRSLRITTQNDIQIRVPRGLEDKIETLEDRIVIHDRLRSQRDDAV
jgi:hypothetical protein